MSKQEQDIFKLKQYAKSLGLSVYFRKYEKGTGAAEYITNTSITIFVGSRTTKTEIILSLLHELGHHLDYLATKTNPEIEKALEYLNNGKISGNRSDIPKKYRKIILDIEKSGINYMPVIYHMLDLSIPYYLVKLQQDVDLREYIVLYKTGKFSTALESSKYFYKRKNYYKRKYNEK